MQKAEHGGMLGSGFITFSCWFLKILFTLLKTFVKQMAFFLCYSCSVTHICSIAYRNHEVLPKPQMSEEFNYNVDALSPLGANTVKGRQGVIYLWAKLPSGAVEVVCKKTWGMFVFYVWGNAFGNIIQDVQMVKVIIYFSFWGYWAICKMPR
jgi:aspartate/methionine/tyrosine aminotransferase